LALPLRAARIAHDYSRFSHAIDVSAFRCSPANTMTRPSHNGFKIVSNTVPPAISDLMASRFIDFAAH